MSERYEVYYLGGDEPSAEQLTAAQAKSSALLLSWRLRFAREGGIREEYDHDDGGVVVVDSKSETEVLVEHHRVDGSKTEYRLDSDRNLTIATYNSEGVQGEPPQQVDYRSYEEVSRYLSDASNAERRGR